MLFVNRKHNVLCNTFWGLILIILQGSADNQWTASPLYGHARLHQGVLLQTLHKASGASSRSHGKQDHKMSAFMKIHCPPLVSFYAFKASKNVNKRRWSYKQQYLNTYTGAVIEVWIHRVAVKKILYLYTNQLSSCPNYGRVTSAGVDGNGRVRTKERAVVFLFPTAGPRTQD